MSKITIRGRAYDLADTADLKSIQAVLVPENFIGDAADGVRLFLSLQNMLSFQLKRHLAANWKTILKTGMEEKIEDAGQAIVPISFAFKLDLSVLTVAAISDHKLSFSVKHETKGKPQTHELNQGEFLDEDMSVVFDVKGFADENASRDEPDPPMPPEENPTIPPIETGTTDQPPEKKKRKKKD